MIPDQLQEIRKDIEDGKRRWAKGKTVLAWFGKKGRGKHVVRAIQEALKETRLVTEPEFSSVGSLHAYIEFKALPEKPATPSGGSMGTGQSEEDAKADPDETQFGDTDLGRTEVSSEEGPKFCIGMLEAANRPSEVLTIKRDQTVEEAITEMMKHRYSQLPVTQNRRDIDGMISWRSIGRARARGAECKHVRDCLENVSVIDQDAAFFDAVETITEKEVVLVLGKDRAISGIVTTSDLSLAYHKRTAPFLWLEEIEDRIRILINRSLPRTEIGRARHGDDTRDVEDAADLTFGEYVRLLERKKNWGKLRLGIDRKMFVALLEDVREVRNDVMHFRPDSSQPENLEKVRELHRLLEQLVPQTSEM